MKPEECNTSRVFNTGDRHLCQKSKDLYYLIREHFLFLYGAMIELKTVPVVIIHHSHVTFDNQTYSNLKLEFSTFCVGGDKFKNRKASSLSS